MNDFKLEDTPPESMAKTPPPPHGTLELSCEDCMALMRRYPDKHFDLAIVDPPYGIGMDGKNNWSGSKHEKKDWDNAPPPMEYFRELFRVSKNQIIWGGNYFPLAPTSCWVVWDKINDGFSFADAELAWTSFETAVRTFRYARGSDRDTRIHPTQKPVALYRWLLERYAKHGQAVLDTHLGFGSHAIACHYAGMHLTACEIDADYFAAAQERIARETRQTTLF
jgi:site-specific DNA-methyltransferase (adenine-specific)